MNTQTTQDYWNALRAPTHTRGALGAEQRTAFQKLWDDPNVAREEVVRVLGDWLETSDLDDVENLSWFWGKIIEETTDEAGQAQWAQTFLDALDSYPVRDHLMSTLGRGQPGPDRARQMLCGVPLLREWLDKREDTSTGAYLLDRMLDNALALACRREEGAQVLTMVLDDPQFGMGRGYDYTHLVSDWVMYAAWDTAATYSADALELLVARGYSPNVSKSGVTPLMEACRAMEESQGSEESKRAIDLLLTAGADWSFLNDNQSEPWEYVQHHPRLKAVRLAELAHTPKTEGRGKLKL